MLGSLMKFFYEFLEGHASTQGVKAEIVNYQYSNNRKRTSVLFSPKVKEHSSLHVNNQRKMYAGVGHPLVGKNLGFYGVPFDSWMSRYELIYPISCRLKKVVLSMIVYHI